MGDKMAREPRLSALSLFDSDNDALNLLREKFTSVEWSYYRNQLHNNLQPVFTSSMGRFLDGIASLLGLADTVSYEGEAAMKLEALALECKDPENDFYDMPFSENTVDRKQMTEQLMDDLKQAVPKEKIAYKVHLSLVKLVERMAGNAGVKQIAFSGGVMQNALLVDLLTDELKEKFELFFHQQLSPNDECISFGQLAYVHLSSEKNNKARLQAVTN